MDQAPPTKRIGTGMFILAWLVAILLLVGFFSGVLEKQENPNQKPVTREGLSGKKEVILQANRQHHYLVNGQINGQQVVFLLDTGATHVAIPAKLAKKLDLIKGQRQTVITASGRSIAYQTTINSLRIGDILLQDIHASINPDMPGEVILLGMSALRELEFTQTGDALILRQ